MKELEKEIVDNEEILKIVKEIKILIKEDKDKNASIKDLKKVYPDEIEKLEETLLYFMGEIDLKIAKIEFPDNKWKYLSKKLAYPYEKNRRLSETC